MSYSISAFIKFYPKYNSKKLIFTALSKFLCCIYKIEREPDPNYEEWRKELDLLSLKYLETSHDYISDLIQFSDHISSLAPLTQRGQMHIVKLWLEENGAVFPKSQMRTLKRIMPKSRVLTDDDPLTSETIQKILTHLRTPGQAILLFMISSGMRIGEVTHIQLENVNFDTDPVEITIPDEVHTSQGDIWNPKNGSGRYTFISSEAAFALREWLKIREEYMTSASKRGGFSKAILDGRVFPFDNSTINKMFTLAIKKSGELQQDPKTRRATITLHSFRKFFISQMKTAMPVEMVELLAGHTGYLSGAYRRYPREQVAEAYKKAEFAVSIHAPVSLPEIMAEREDTKAQINMILSELTRSRLEQEDLKKALEGLNERKRA